MNKGLVIARGGFNLRKSPKIGKVLSTLRKGSKVEILEQETWLRVKASDGSVGYVLADYIEKDKNNIVNIEGVESGLTVIHESDQCIIKHYTNSQFIGNELRADADFIPHLDKVNKFAKKCNTKIYITSSTREPGRTVSGSIVPPAARSNHLVGHAIDMNLKSGNGFYNSKKLKKSNFSKLPTEIKIFLELVREDSILRWGGDFSKEDSVHIDDNLNNRNPERWDLKLASR